MGIGPFKPFHQETTIPIAKQLVLDLVGMQSFIADVTYVSQRWVFAYTHTESGGIVGAAPTQYEVCEFVLGRVKSLWIQIAVVHCIESGLGRSYPSSIIRWVATEAGDLVAHIQADHRG